jgi:hypothetical protein
MSPFCLHSAVTYKDIMLRKEFLRCGEVILFECKEKTKRTRGRGSQIEKSAKTIKLDTYWVGI